MPTISVPTIARNVIKLNYPLDRVIKSIAPLVDEVIISVDPTSVDDSVDYVHDLMLEVNSSIGRDVVRYIESCWDLDNIGPTGPEFARQTNIAMDACTGDWLFYLQCDEAIHEKDYSKIRSLITAEDVDAYSMARLYFYGDLDTVRDDWTTPIIRLFRKGTRVSSGDAMNTSGDGIVKECDVPIYHYSRIGDPSIITKRILSLDKLFHSNEKLLDEEELKPYDFSTHNFDCMHKSDVDVGRQEVGSNFSIFFGTHPSSFIGYEG